MPKQQPTLFISIPDAGITSSLGSQEYYERYVIKMTQTGTLSGNISITSSGSDDDNAVYQVEFPGSVVLGAQTCTIFGKALTAAQCLNPCLIIARWDDTAGVFRTQIYTDWSASNTVQTSHINADAVTTAKVINEAITLDKMADLTQNHIIAGNAANRPVAINGGAGTVLYSNGTDLAFGSPSGDFTWNATLVATIANNAITTPKILDTAVTLAKFAALAQGSLIRGNSSNRPEAFLANTSGNVVMGDGTDVISQAISGDASLSGAGALTISVGLNTYITSVLIPTASVLTGNSVPVTIVGAQGVGKIIQPIAATETLTFNSAAYATNGVTNLRIQTATDACMTLGTSFLFGTTTKVAVMSNNPINAVTDTQLLSNQPLLWEVGTGDPTTGDSDITVTCMYRVIDV